MHLLLTDETNVVPDKATKFFVYGGLIVDLANLSDLDTAMAAIRAKYGYKPTDTLKFDTNARPKGLTRDQVTEAKKEVLNACSDAKCLFIAYVVLHAIAQTRAGRRTTSSVPSSKKQN